VNRKWPLRTTFDPLHWPWALKLPTANILVGDSFQPTGTPPKLGRNMGKVTQMHKNLEYLRNGAS